MGVNVYVYDYDSINKPHVYTSNTHLAYVCPIDLYSLDLVVHPLSAGHLSFIL